VDGCLVYVDSKQARLNFFKLDGSNALRTVPMRSAPDKFKFSYPPPHVSFSPDGRYVYYANVANVLSSMLTKPSEIDPNWPQGRVYRQDLSKPGSDPERFYDLELPDWDKTKYWLPHCYHMMTAASDIDTDAKGNVLVCDLVNQEVVELDSAGKKLSAAKVPWPNRIVAARKSGTLYVISNEVKPNGGRTAVLELLKITGRGADAKMAGRLALTKGMETFGCLAVDESGEFPVIWVLGETSLARVEDWGAEVGVDPLGDFSVAASSVLVRYNAVTLLSLKKNRTPLSLRS
jgi:hypothetical protein